MCLAVFVKVYHPCRGDRDPKPEDPDWDMPYYNGGFAGEVRDPEIKIP